MDERVIHEAIEKIKREANKPDAWDEDIARLLKSCDYDLELTISMLKYSEKKVDPETCIITEYDEEEGEKVIVRTYSGTDWVIPYCPTCNRNLAAYLGIPRCPSCNQKLKGQDMLAVGCLIDHSYDSTIKK